MKRMRLPSLGIAFSPAGLLTPFHLGASQQLVNLRILSESTALSGASGEQNDVDNISLQKITFLV
jgi:hypothetical protein